MTFASNIQETFKGLNVSRSSFFVAIVQYKYEDYYHNDTFNLEIN
jgi:hypothetical protein